VLVEVRVGVIGRAHGVRGDVTVDVRTDDPDVRFADGAVLRDEATGRELTIAGSRWHSGRLLVRFDGITDRTQAEQARGAVLVVDVDADDRPADPDELYDRQLVGLRVLDAAGTERGRVDRVVHLPGQDLLEVDTPVGPRLVPFVAEIVVDVDLPTATVRLADVPGLLDDLVDDPDDPAEQQDGPAGSHP